MQEQLREKARRDRDRRVISSCDSNVRNAVVRRYADGTEEEA